MEEKSGKRVWVIVEDEPSLRMMLSAAMMLIWNVEPLTFDDGYQAMAWLDGIEAQQQTDARLPELALLDIRMPGPQGPEIAERLRRVPATSKIAIVMMTAYRLDPDERALIMKMASPQAMVSKPLPMLSELKQTLEDAIASTRSGILSPIEIKASPKDPELGLGLSRLPTLEELIAGPEKPKQEPAAAGTPVSQEPAAASKEVQQGLVTGTASPKEPTAAPKEVPQGPGVTAPQSPKAPTAAPKEAQPEPVATGTPGSRDLITALRGLQQGSNLPDMPGAKDPATTPEKPQPRPATPGSIDLITALRGLQQESRAASNSTLKGTPPAPEKTQQGAGISGAAPTPEKPQQEPGTSDAPPQAPPVRPQHGRGALGTKELPPDPEGPQRKAGDTSASGSRSSGQV